MELDTPLEKVADFLAPRTAALLVDEPMEDVVHVMMTVRAYVWRLEQLLIVDPFTLQMYTDLVVRAELEELRSA